MLKIKLTRIGKNSQPFYRIVVAEARSKSNGKYYELLGTYNPLLNPPQITLDLAKYNTWITKGAQPTLTVKHLHSLAAK